MTPTYPAPLREATPKAWDYFPAAIFERNDEGAEASFEGPRLWVYWGGTRYCLRVAGLDLPPELSAGDVVCVLVLPGGTARLRKAP